MSLSSSDETVRLLAKVDTGAEYCLFERGYAEALLIELERGTPSDFSTVAGRCRASGHELALSVLGVEIRALVSFFEDPNIRRNVLGRNGCSNRVRLGLVEHDSLIYLSAYDD